MPELPEVETVRRGLEPAMAGASFTGVTLRRPALRFPLPERFAERLTGARVAAVRRRAKYLVAPLSTGEALVMHLGMTGRFTVERPGLEALEPGAFYAEAGRQATHDHVVFELSNGARVTYNDARRFGFMDLVPLDALETSRHFSSMGVEPLGGTLDGPALAALMARTTTPLKAALLDQKRVAGLGNIYVCEALHRAGLSPLRAAGTLAEPAGSAAAARLVEAIRAVLTEAVAVGGSTLRDYQHTDGGQGAFQERFRVYDRVGEPCPTPGCAGTVGRLVQSGRSTFWCDACQL